MKVKTFRGRTMGEALAEVRRGMGNSAVILFTRTVRSKGLFGIMGRQVVEIGAVPEGDVDSLRKPATKRTGQVEKIERTYGLSRVDGATARPAGSDDLSQIRRELTVVRQSVENAIRQSCAADVADLPQPLVEIYLGLVRHELSRHTAANIVREVAKEIGSESMAEAVGLTEMVARRLAGLITTGGAVNLQRCGRPRVVALVGPTGVGKTTTVAKLAGDINVSQGRKVGLITIDTYRIAAVQQLKTIADIVRVPLRTVLTTDELQGAIADFRDMDLVIIDTAGRGQRDDFKMNELGSFIRAAQPDETHLVLAATARPKNLREVVERFKPVGVNRLVLSKVDEAEGIGAAFTVAAESKVAVSYVTNGQDIPDDIEVADALGLARMVACGVVTGKMAVKTGNLVGEVGA